MSTSEYRKNVNLDLIHTFLRSLNFTHGIWYVYLLHQGFTYFEVGIFETIFHFTSLTMEVPTGIVADLYGRKVSRVLGIFSYVIYVLILIYSTNIILVSIAFIFCGLSFTFESGSGEALVYDSMKISGDESFFINFLGKKEILYQIASTIALFIGGWIALTSFKINFWIVLIGYTGALTAILLMKETPLILHKKTKKVAQLLYEHFVISTKTVFSNKRLTLLIIIGALVSAPITSLFFLISDHLISNLGYSKFLMGILLGTHAAAGAIGGYFAYKLEKHYSEKMILYLVPFFTSISFWLILIDQIIFVPFVLLGFLDSVFYVVLGDYINKIAPSEQRATILSFGGMSFSISMIILFPIVGWISDNYGMMYSFAVLASIVTIIFFIMVIIIKNNHLVHKKD